MYVETATVDSFTVSVSMPEPADGTRSRAVWRGVAGVALASVILGGAGGAVLGAVSGGTGDTGRMGGPGAGVPGNHGGMPGGVPGQIPSGQLPRGTAPQQGQGATGS